MKRLIISLWLSVVLSVVAVIPSYSQSATAKIPLTRGPLVYVNEYFSSQITTYNDGTTLERSTIKGPPVPSSGYELERVPILLAEPAVDAGFNKLNVPAFKWVFGCSAVSGAMIAGYYDRRGFPNMYSGPSNNGVIPLDDLSWSGWTDNAGKWYPNNPLIASHSGSDGRITPGSIDNYWVYYGSGSDDPYIAGAWQQHDWEDAIGDYMKTSQSAYGNSDGATSFYSFLSASPLTCGTMENYNIHNEDGTYGRKLFYEARGYTVTDCYTQKTDNVFSGGFSFSQYKAEIDAGRPVLLNLVGHSIVGVGYDDSSNTVYIHDTWDNNVHIMTWGGSYSGMSLRSVSIVSLQESPTGIPEMSVSPISHDFGNVNILNAPTQTFTILNTGTGDIIVGTITIGGEQAPAFSLHEDNCSGQTLAPSMVCTVSVTFTPSEYGHHLATLEIVASNPINSIYQVALSGTVVYEATPSALEGTLGTEITYTGAPSGFGAKKGKVFIGGLEQRVTFWSDTSVMITVLKLPVPAEETYDVRMQPKQEGIPAINLPRAFSVKKPEIDESSNNNDGAQGDRITIKGMWFGAKKGKAYIGGQKCRIKLWDMIPTTGASTIVLQVPANATKGTYDLEVENKVGTSLPLSFTVEPQPVIH